MQPQILRPSQTKHLAVDDYSLSSTKRRSVWDILYVDN